MLKFFVKLSVFIAASASLIYASDRLEDVKASYERSMKAENKEINGPPLAEESAFSAFLDLEGDEIRKEVILPFPYYERKNDDQLTLIHQGGYKVYNIQKDGNKVAVIGTLKPCIAIAATDGKSLIVFHKHWTNSLESLKKSIKEHIDLSNKYNVYARIYTTRDDINWKLFNWGLTHNNCTPEQEVKRIRGFLIDEIGISEYNILTKVHNLLDENQKSHNLGKYQLSELCVAVRMRDIFELKYDFFKEIKFMSIDPYVEDVMNLNEKNVTYAQYYGDRFHDVQEKYPNQNFKKALTPYNKIQEKWKNEAHIFCTLDILETERNRGYMIQMRITMECIHQHQEKLYRDHLNIEEAELKRSKFGTLNFYQIG